MTINIEPIERALGFIEAHPEQHDQKTWTCETGACLAGWIALQNGYEVERDKWGELQRGYVVDAEGRSHFVPDVARNILGISTSDENMILFAATNTVEKLKLMVKDLANGEDLNKTWVQVGTKSFGDDDFDMHYPVFERVE